MERYIGCESDSWQQPRSKGLFRIMWTPRWSTGEGNCTFFDYKDKLPEYVQNHKDIELLFRPHPQAFAEFVAKKEMTAEQVKNYKELYSMQSMW